jgi:hydroxypyruvate reductase
MALDAIEGQARALGLQVERLTERVSGPAAEAGVAFAQALLASTADLMIAGGETTVSLPAAPGRGGRAQHLALAAAQVLDGQPNAMLLSAGTDGIDGASDDAGAVVDGGTVSRAAWDGESAAASLRQADAGRCLEASGDLIHTGPTTTNVGDLLMGLKMSEAQWARLVA